MSDTEDIEYIDNRQQIKSKQYDDDCKIIKIYCFIKEYIEEQGLPIMNKEGALYEFIELFRK